MKHATLAVAVLLLLPTVAAIPAFDEAPWGAWKREVVFPGSTSFDKVYIAVGQDGAVHVAFTVTTWNNATYGRKTPTGWDLQQLTSRANVIGLALDAGGVPHVVTAAHTGNDEIRFWRITAAGTSSEVITSHTLNHASAFGQLVFDASGRPHLIEIGIGSHTLRYAYRDAGIWRLETVATGAGSSGGIAVIGESVHVVYNTYVGGTAVAMRHAVRSPSGAWTETVVPGCPVDFSMAAGTAGDLHVSCNWGSPEALGYRHWDGSSWTTELVDPAPRRGRDTAIAVDSLNRPHIAYTLRGITDSVTDPNQAYYAMKSGGRWWLDSADRISLQTGYQPGIAVDTANRPHLAFAQAAIGWTIPPEVRATISDVNKGIIYATPVASAIPSVG